MIIYAIIDPLTAAVRYVGFTSKTAEERLRGHLDHAKEGRTNHHSNWLRKLLKEDLRPFIVVLEEVNDENWIERERYWIRFFSSLLNINKGGERVNFTPEVREKMGRARRGKPGKKGVVVSPETRAKISASLRGRGGTPHSEESKLKMSRIAKEKGRRPSILATKEQKQAAMSIYWTEERRAALSAVMSERWKRIRLEEANGQ